MKTLKLTAIMILAATLRACNPVPCVANTQADDYMPKRCFNASQPSDGTLSPSDNQSQPERQVQHGERHRGGRGQSGNSQVNIFEKFHSALQGTTSLLS